MSVRNVVTNNVKYTYCDQEKAVKKTAPRSGGLFMVDIFLLHNKTLVSFHALLFSFKFITGKQVFLWMSVH